MTKIVYASPDISPDVWTPPRGVVVLPLSEHPAIVAESAIERMPGEPRRTPRRTKETQAERITGYLQKHPPATTYEIGETTGIHWQRVQWVLLNNPEIFQAVGRIKAHKVYRTLWGLVES